MVTVVALAGTALHAFAAVWSVQVQPNVEDDV
jgi:hypothetical protein